MVVAQKRTFQVTRRDLDMLASIVVARYLTAEALEWLHWPTWRDRWKAAQAGGKAEEYRPAPHLYRRLSHLVDAGLLYKLRRPIEVVGYLWPGTRRVYAVARRRRDAGELSP